MPNDDYTPVNMDVLFALKPGRPESSHVGYDGTPESWANVLRMRRQYYAKCQARDVDPLVFVQGNAQAERVPTVAELLTPLALCGRVEDERRRAVLMSGVMADLSWSPWSKPTLHEADPAWSDVQALIVPRCNAPQRAAPGPGPRKAGLWLFVSHQLTELEQGEWVEWSWPFGGQEQLLIGVVETNEPLVLRAHRSFYDEAGRQVPEFLRAYDGLLLLGFSAKQARVLVQRTPSKALLEVVVGAYRQKDELHNPRAYVEKLVQPLKVA